ncbi:MAG: alpha-xylosidase, partial [Dysgonamonadaceae bacterium]|nr:alpha-xylosidase [Dysgonamonadaceae bacterium]
DFEGYISNGDINKNGLIDAYDISVVATQLKGGVKGRPDGKVAGSIEISAAKQSYNAGDIIELQVKGIDLHAVNALSFAIPYNTSDYEFTGDIQLLNMKEMENLTYDRLHTNGVKALYPTFVNVGDKATLEGSTDLFVIKFKAKRKLKLDLKAIDGILIDKSLNTKKVL